MRNRDKNVSKILPVDLRPPGQGGRHKTARWQPAATTTQCESPSLSCSRCLVVVVSLNCTVRLTAWHYIPLRHKHSVFTRRQRCRLSKITGDIAESDFAYWYRCYRLVVSLSVTFVHCAQTAEHIDIIFLHATAPYPSQIALKFCLQDTHIGQPFFPNIWSEIDPPLLSRVG